MVKIEVDAIPGMVKIRFFSDDGSIDVTKRITDQLQAVTLAGAILSCSKAAFHDNGQPSIAGIMHHGVQPKGENNDGA